MVQPSPARPPQTAEIHWKRTSVENKGRCHRKSKTEILMGSEIGLIKNRSPSLLAQSLVTLHETHTLSWSSSSWSGAGCRSMALLHVLDQLAIASLPIYFRSLNFGGFFYSSNGALEIKNRSRYLRILTWSKVVNSVKFTDGKIRKTNISKFQPQTNGFIY